MKQINAVYSNPRKDILQLEESSVINEHRVWDRERRAPWSVTGPILLIAKLFKGKQNSLYAISDLP